MEAILSNMIYNIKKSRHAAESVCDFYIKCRPKNLICMLFY